MVYHFSCIVVGQGRSGGIWVWFLERDSRDGAFFLPLFFFNVAEIVVLFRVPHFLVMWRFN
jgi:hypothetical protein